MGKKHAFLLVTCAMLVTSPAVATTPVPSPSPTQTVVSICAPIATGIPQKVPEPKCPQDMRTLGRGPVVHGTTRPKAIHPHLKSRFLTAQTAAANLGFKISVHSGWRSWETQSRLYQNALTKYKSPKVASRWVLPPDKSMHVWGVALDLHFDNAAAQNWFRWNSNHFGLCRTYKNEWWHFEPVISPGDKCPPMQPFAK